MQKQSNKPFFSSPFLIVNLAQSGLPFSIMERESHKKPMLPLKKVSTKLIKYESIKQIRDKASTTCNPPNKMKPIGNG